MLDSFQNSLRGLRYGLAHEKWVRIEIVAVVLGAILAFAVAGTAVSWALLVGSLILVAAFEMLNTAVEAVCDEISEDKREKLGTAKDAASAAVWLAKLTAALLWAGAIVARL